MVVRWNITLLHACNPPCYIFASKRYTIAKGKIPSNSLHVLHCLTLCSSSYYTLHRMLRLMAFDYVMLLLEFISKAFSVVFLSLLAN